MGTKMEILLAAAELKQEAIFDTPSTLNRCLSVSDEIHQGTQVNIHMQIHRYVPPCVDVHTCTQVYRDVSINCILHPRLHVLAVISLRACQTLLVKLSFVECLFKV